MNTNPTQPTAEHQNTETPGTQSMFLSRLSVRKPVLMTMVIFVFVVLGAYAYLDLPVDLFPDIDIPIVTVQTVYPGAGPEEIENLVSRPIEEVVGAISGVKDITSASQEGLSSVLVEFEVGVDLDVAALDVKDKVGSIRAELPEDIEEPVILKVDIGALPIMNLAVSSPRPLRDLYELTDDVIKQELSKIPGLAQITIVGGTEREIMIGVDRERLQAYGLGIQEVVAALGASNLEVPSGHITEVRREYPIRVAGEFEKIQQIEEMELLTVQGTSIRLRDIARVVDTYEELREKARYNGRTAVGLTLIKRPDANIVNVADQVKREVERMQDLLPADVAVAVAQDQSLFIRQSINELVDNMALGILLTALVLYVFLHNWQGTVIAALSIPASVIATFLLLRFADFTINMMTLSALAIIVGILVTNSIVVLESIIRHLERGETAATASNRGTAEIAVAVAASTLTNIVVFTPLAFMGGIVGQFFLQFGVTAVFATLYSLLTSYTLTPMLASLLYRPPSAHGSRLDVVVLMLIAVGIVGGSMIPAVFVGRVLPPAWGTAGVFGTAILAMGIALWILRGLLKTDMSVLSRHPLFRLVRIVVIAVAAGACGAVVFLLLQRLFGTPAAGILMGLIAVIAIAQHRAHALDRFTTAWERGYAVVMADYRAMLDWALNQVGTVIFLVFAVLMISLYLGKYVGSEFFPESDRGMLSVTFEMSPGSSLEATDQVMQAGERLLRERPEVKAMYTEVGRTVSTFHGGSSQGIRVGQIAVELVDRDQRALSLSQFMEDIRPALAVIPAADIALLRTGAGGGETDLSVEVSGEELPVMETIAKDVEALLRRTNNVVDVQSSWKSGVPELKVVPDRRRLTDYGITTAQIASVLRTSIEGTVASKFRVQDKEYDIRVRFDERYRDQAEQVYDIMIQTPSGYVPLPEIAQVEQLQGPVQISRKNKQRLITLTANVLGRSSGEVVNELRAVTDRMQLPPGYRIYYGGRTEDQAEAFAEMFKAMIMAVILTYMVLAAMLESFLHPLTIMLTLPLGLIGVLLSLIITGKTNNIMTMMAVIMLVGIVVNNAILQLDFIQQLRQQGLKLREAVLTGAQERLRPILMTNIAAIISVIPMALGLGEGGEFRAPLAIVTIGGLASSSVFTLFLIPVVYYSFERIKTKGQSA